MISAAPGGTRRQPLPGQPDSTRFVRSRARNAFWVVFLVGLCARALVSFWIVPSWESSAGVADSPDRYPTLARELLEHGAFGYGAEGATPTTVRGPAFPLWLALPVAGGVVRPQALGLWGALPMVLLAAWLARLLQTHHGAIVGFAAGLLIVLHPLPAFTSGRVMGDEFYGAAGFAGLAMLVAPRSAAALKRTSGSAVLAMLAGALISIATLARATGCAVPHRCGGFDREGQGVSTGTAGARAIDFGACCIASTAGLVLALLAAGGSPGLRALPRGVQLLVR